MSQRPQKGDWRGTDYAETKAAKQLRGFKQCVWTISYNKKAYEAPGGQRQAVKRKGEQCRCMVSPEQQQKMGLPICTSHEKIFLESVAEVEAAKAARNKAMRAKYDPGPLPL